MLPLLIISDYAISVMIPELYCARKQKNRGPKASDIKTKIKGDNKNVC